LYGSKIEIFIYTFFLLNIFKGQITYKAVADAFGHKYVSPSEALTN